MGLLFGKKKVGEEETTVTNHSGGIRKTTGGSQPRPSPYSDSSSVDTTKNSQNVTVLNTSTADNGTIQSGGNNNKNGGVDSGGGGGNSGGPVNVNATSKTGTNANQGASSGLNAGLNSNFTKASGGNQTTLFSFQGGSNTTISSPNSDVNFAIDMTSNNGSANNNTNNYQSQQAQNQNFQTPVSRVLNLYGLSISLFNITRAILFEEWTDKVFLQLIDVAITDLERELAIVKNNQLLRDWIHPLHFRKTGSVIGAARQLSQNHKYFMEVAQKLRKINGEGFGASEQRQFRENLKEMLRSFLQLCICVELVVPSDFSTEINEFAKTIKDVVDTSSGKIDFVFDDVARICITSSVRLSRLALWKNLHIHNIPWSRQVNDTCFTISKATKVLYVIGQRLYDNMSDKDTYDNLTTLTKGIIVQIKKIQNMTQTEPPEVKQNMFMVTSEIIDDHIAAYDTGIKEVQTTISTCVSDSINDTSTISVINKIITQLETIKQCVKQPNAPNLISAVATISDSVEKFCGSVYNLLHLLSENNEVIKEQVMETMLLAIHCTIHLQIVASLKSLYFNIINPEVTMLVCLRLLLLAVSFLLEAVHFMKINQLIEADFNFEETPLSAEEINEALIYILHYGRPLFRGDEGDDNPKEEYQDEKPNPDYEDDNVDFNIGYEVEPEPVMKTTSKLNLSQPKNPQPKPQETKSSQRTLVEKPIAEPVKKVEEKKPITVAEPVKEKRAKKSIGEEKKPVAEKQIAEPVKKVEEKKPAAAATNGLTLEDEDLLKVDVDSYNENNLPPGFENPPPKPVFNKGGTEAQYKAFMIAKYEYETWENKLILHKIKLKKRKEEIKAKR